MPFDIRFIPIFACGFVGGLCAYVIGIPMPFVLGGIGGAASFVLWYERDGRQLPAISRWVRLVFMAIIGTMIGSRFSPELLPLLPQYWISVAALIPFILLAHVGSFAIMVKLGGYKKLDAYYAALPAGIIDSVALAAAAGADLRIVTAQHFMRIILVVCSIPLLFFFIQGDAVGSLAGDTMSSTDTDFKDVVWVLAVAVTGLFFGRLSRLPVSHMLGPLILTIVLSVTGLVDIQIPAWLGHGAQFIIGTALGAQFSGISRKLLVRGLGMGLIAGGYMLALAATFATLLTPVVPADFGAMFISFAAGGVAEMSLIALSLNFNPVVVAMHHLLRILLTVWLGRTLSSYFVPRRSNG